MKTKKRNLVIVIVMSLALTACHTGPDYGKNEHNEIVMAKYYGTPAIDTIAGQYVVVSAATINFDDSIMVKEYNVVFHNDWEFKNFRKEAIGRGLHIPIAKTMYKGYYTPCYGRYDRINIVQISGKNPQKYEISASVRGVSAPIALLWKAKAKDKHGIEFNVLVRDSLVNIGDLYVFDTRKTPRHQGMYVADKLN